jgi:hypothetical protein
MFSFWSPVGALGRAFCAVAWPGGEAVRRAVEKAFSLAAMASLNVLSSMSFTFYRETRSLQQGSSPGFSAISSLIQSPPMVNIENLKFSRPTTLGIMLVALPAGWRLQK